VTQSNAVRRKSACKVRHNFLLISPAAQGGIWRMSFKLYPKGGNEDVKSNFYTRQGVKSNKIIIFAPERV
jgi:hypothetical protein